jgi:prevent-host-death family protein
MDAVKLADAKAHLSELVDRAQSGETVEITRHGRAAARLAPPETPRKPIDVKALAALTARLPRQKDGAVRTMRASDRY